MTADVVSGAFIILALPTVLLAFLISFMLLDISGGLLMLCLNPLALLLLELGLPAGGINFGMGNIAKS